MPPAHQQDPEQKSASFLDLLMKIPRKQKADAPAKTLTSFKQLLKSSNQTSQGSPNVGVRSNVPVSVSNDNPAKTAQAYNTFTLLKSVQKRANQLQA